MVVAGDDPRLIGQEVIIPAVLPCNTCEICKSGRGNRCLNQKMPGNSMGSTIVVTHFAPSLQSADPRYGLTPGTAGFCNALDDLLPHADLWLHGHLHAPSDYMLRGCRVVANPLGYARKNEQSMFRPTGLIEI